MQGVLGLQATYDRHTPTRGVDDGTQQSRPLVIIQVWAFAHRRGDLEHRCTCSQPALDPPLGQVGHDGSVELEVAVERTGKCSNGSLYQTFELIAVHRDPVGIVEKTELPRVERARARHRHRDQLERALHSLERICLVVWREIAREAEEQLLRAATGG